MNRADREVRKGELYRCDTCLKVKRAAEYTMPVVDVVQENTPNGLAATEMVICPRCMLVIGGFSDG